MGDRMEDRRPEAAAASSGAAAAAAGASPSRSNDSAAAAAAAAAPAAVAGGAAASQPPDEYVVIQIRLQHLRVLLFVLITVLSIGGAVYGFVRLPLLLAPPLPLHNLTRGPDPFAEGSWSFLHRHDRNGDGALDVDEVEPLAFLLWESRAIATDHEQPLSENEERVKIRSFFEPLQVNTMSKKLDTKTVVLSTFADIVQRFFGFGLLPYLFIGRLPTSSRVESLRGLLDWTAPHREVATFGAEHLAATFLPPAQLAEELGKPYALFDLSFGDNRTTVAGLPAAGTSLPVAGDGATAQHQQPRRDQGAAEAAAAAAVAAAAAAAAEDDDSAAVTAAAEATANAQTGSLAAGRAPAGRVAPVEGHAPGSAGGGGSDEDEEHKLRLHILGNRYYPPRLGSDSAVTLHRLLAMFHPRPFLATRFPPQGSLGCLRALNDEYAEVVFRLHAEFQLNDPPLYPFWFTPAQFKGSAIIARNSSSVVSFRLYVPNDRRLNVDMEWMNAARAHENMEVDIGYMPRMELVAVNEDAEGFTRPPVSPSSFQWTKEVQIDVCERNMEVHFYPFKKVPYFNYTEAFAEAGREGKLVHSIVLWGALDDQSC